MKLQDLLFLGSLASATASALIYPRNSSDTGVIDFKPFPASSNLTWQPCGSYQCAVFEVPLDYTQLQGDKAHIPLLKLPAASQPSKGMLLLNFGGPGMGGAEGLQGLAPVLQLQSGGQFDLVSWEPRGLGASTPSAVCSAPTTPKRASETPAGSNAGGFIDSVFADAKSVGETCKSTIGGPTGAGAHMTTKVVVQDMVSLLDAYAASEEGQLVEDPSLLNYWGFSYGTVVGQTFASMFPDRVNKLVLDGVVDASEYVVGNLEKWLIYQDDVFSSFFVYCYLAGPTKCSYYTGNSAGDIFGRFEQTMARLDIRTAKQQKWDNATLIEKAVAAFKVTVFKLDYNPLGGGFDLTTKLLASLEKASQGLTSESLTGFQQAIDSALPKSDVPQVSISCSDNGNIYYNKSLAEMMPLVDNLRNSSWIGGDPLSKNVVACTGWGINGVERFAGPFGGNTKNPILIVSTTRDPVTPDINGQRATELFSGSQHLTIDGSGHTSPAVSNPCAIEKIQAYFNNGTMPGSNNYCEQSVGPWGVEIPGGLKKRDDWAGIQERMKAIRLASAGEHDVKIAGSHRLVKPSSYVIFSLSILAVFDL